MKKLTKLAKTLDTFLVFVSRLAIAGTIFSSVILFFCIYLALGSDTILEELGLGLVQSISFGGLSFQIADSYPMQDISGTAIFLGSWGIAIAMIVVYFLMVRVLRDLLLPMKEGTPFTKYTVLSLRQLAVLVGVNGLLNEIYEALTLFVFNKGYDLNQLFANGNIESVTANYTFSLNFILYALVLLGLSYIFQYGLELQTLSDETL